MSDYIHTLIEFSTKESFNKFCNLYITNSTDAKPDEETSYFDFEKVIPSPKSQEECPEYFITSTKYKFKNAKYDMSKFMGDIADEEPKGFDWWNWSRIHWGTKWNSLENKIDSDSLIIGFDTAWNCPTPVFKEISIKRPDIWKDMFITSIGEYNYGNEMLRFGGQVDQSIKSFSNVKNYKEKWETIKDIDGLTVIADDTNPRNFDSYEQFLEVHPKAQDILTYFDESTLMETQFEFIKNEEVEES